MGTRNVKQWPQPATVRIEGGYKLVFKGTARVRVYLPSLDVDVRPATFGDIARWVAMGGYAGDWPGKMSPDAFLRRIGYSHGKAEQPASGLTWYEADAFAVSQGKRLLRPEEWCYLAAPWPPQAIRRDHASTVGPVTDKGRLDSPFGVLALSGVVKQWCGHSQLPDVFGPPPAQRGDAPVCGVTRASREARPVRDLGALSFLPPDMVLPDLGLRACKELERKPG